MAPTTVVLTDSDDEFGDFDDAALDEMAAFEAAVLSGHKLPPRTVVSRPGLQQRDLFGGVVAQKEPKGGGGSGAGAGGNNNKHSVGGPSGPGKETAAKVRLSKKWDPASFAKHGWSKKNAAAAKAKAKGKGKGRAHASDEENWDDEDVRDDDDDDDENQLLDTSYDPAAPLLPIKWPPDAVASKTWQYPVQADKPLRTYQYNIVHRCLFENTLVSLPTGLGKTFIAACVMLNFYRWYPHGTIIFLAPTRPLVTQQITACHYIAGIPQSDCVELTGQTAPSVRAVAWSSKRVVYCTPQTLENDLAKGRIDPRDITCLVVDEAHRASGDYAYVGVVRFIMSRNQHFRVLALTATPGSRGEAVQSVIDNLHIGKIEVRTDESIDIRQYMHTKEYDLQVVSLGPIITSIRDRWAKLMGMYHGPLLSARLIYEANPVFLSPYAVQMANGKIKDLPGGAKSNGRYYIMIKTLATMARAMEYLVIQSLTEFQRVVKDLESEGPKALGQHPEFRSILRETSELRGLPGYVGHPKMSTLREMCAAHFERCANEVDPDTGAPVQTRVMVFCNYRAVVGEIVDCLNQQRPLIKATEFVGQSSAKGVKGKTQKDQIETIKKFKAGTYNVLVATSIGEEGLDIGEIDLIVCYEANKSPIRMLQRVGRTGRARDGTIIVLMTEGREEKNWDKAKDAYNEVQNALISNNIFELYVDGDRMLPKEIKPEVEKIEIHALKLDMEKMTMNGEARLERKVNAESKKKQPKKARDPKLNVPHDAFLGFRTAGEVNRIATVAAAPSPGKELRERSRAALLAPEQAADLRERWQYSGDKRVLPIPFDPSTLPFERGSTGSALRIPMHSSRHLDALALLKTYAEMDESKPDEFDKWHARMSAAFNPKLITVWTPPKDDVNGTPRVRRVHPRVRRSPPVADPLSSTPPLPTPPYYHFTQPQQAYIPTQAAPPAGPVASTSDAKAPPAQTAVSKLAQFRRPASPPHSPPPGDSSHNSKRPPPPVSAPAPPAKRPRTSPAPAPRPPVEMPQAKVPIGKSLVRDPYLARPSGEDEVEVQPRAKPVPLAHPAPKPVVQPDAKPMQVPPGAVDDSFSMFDDDGSDDFDMGMSDSQLLRGAFVVAGKGPKEEEEDLVVADSEDEGSVLGED
ncbi:hypothetical protein RQP46_000494 [Phenoliferia psychrophenolica]